MQSVHRWSRRGLALALVAILALALSATSNDGDPVDEIQAELISVEGTETSYGISLTLESLPLFIDWSFTLVPLVESDPRYYDALSSLVAPCCDDNTAHKCCCEDGGQSCNIIRSGKGLAAYLIFELDYTTEAVAESVLEWFHFARPDYYVAAELEARGINPRSFDLTTRGSCYRSMCSTPVSEGGCGGMNELIEPAIDLLGG
jgi:hypothetical protein